MRQVLTLLTLLLCIAGKIHADSYTTVYDIATTLSDASATYQGSTATITPTTAVDEANAPNLFVNALNGKLGNNGSSWSQINDNTILVLPGVSKGSIITFSLYDTTALTIDGTAFTNGQSYTATANGNVVMTCTTGGYIKSITVVGNAFSTTYTTIYDIAATLESTYEGRSGTLDASSADTNANAPELGIDATSGKLGVNNTSWSQLNAGVVLSLANVPKGATIMFSLYDKTALTISGTAYTNGGTYSTTAKGDVTMTCTTSGYIKSITVLGKAFNSEEEEEEEEATEYTNTWQFGKSNDAETFALQKSAEYTYTVNGYSLVINTDAGKLNNSGRTDQWAQCNDGTLFKVPVFKGAKLSWGKYNGGSTTGFTIGGQLYNDYYVATADGTTNMMATGISYISYITVEPVTLYEITGTISGGSIDDASVLLTATGNGQVYSATISSSAFTLKVPAGTYSLSLSDGVAYVISTPSSVTVSEAGSIGAITIVSAAPQTVSGNIVNAPDEAFTLTFTSASHTETVNCEAGATSYTKDLEPDTYTMSSSVGTLSTLSAASFTVVNSAVSHNIYFPETIPAATQQNITVDNTATVAANVYNTVTDALAAAKAGSISSPIITLTSGQTYREQVVVDMANVTLKTSGTEKATITWYYGIGYSYYSLNASGMYDKDRAMTRNEKLTTVGPWRWGATVLVKNTGTGFKAENVIFENSFNQYYTTEEVEDGVEYNLQGSSITYDRTLTSGQSGYKAADSKAATERAAAIAFENNPSGCQLYNCEFKGSQDTFYSSGSIYVKNCSIMGNTDYIFGGGNVVFDDCDLVIGGYSDQETSAYITANNAGTNEYYIFRDCTVKPSTRTYIASNLGRDWGGANTHVYFFNLKNEIGNKLSYTWSNMGNGVSAGTADLHIYDFDPTVNANYNTTGSAGANINGLVSDETAESLYTGVVSRLGFTPEHVYDIPLHENSYYNALRIKASNGGTGDITLTRSIAKDKWSTIVVPFDIANVETVFGEGTTVAELTSGTATTLNFTTRTAMEANKPYAIKVTNDFSSATIEDVTIEESTTTQTVGNWQFVGTYASGSIPEGSYFFSGNQLWLAEDDSNTIAPFRAYFTTTEQAARELTFFIDGEKTDIRTIDNGPQAIDHVYNLNGQRVAQPTKGLYIVNGRKVVIR